MNSRRPGLDAEMERRARMAEQQRTEGLPQGDRSRDEGFDTAFSQHVPPLELARLQGIGLPGLQLGATSTGPVAIPQRGPTSAMTLLEAVFANQPPAVGLPVPLGHPGGRASGQTPGENVAARYGDGVGAEYPGHGLQGTVPGVEWVPPPPGVPPPQSPRPVPPADDVQRTPGGTPIPQAPPIPPPTPLDAPPHEGFGYGVRKEASDGRHGACGLGSGPTTREVIGEPGYAVSGPVVGVERNSG